MERQENERMFLEYFDEYIKAHSKEAIGLYELTNDALNYCLEKISEKRSCEKHEWTQKNCKEQY